MKDFYWFVHSLIELHESDRQQIIFESCSNISISLPISRIWPFLVNGTTLTLKTFEMDE